MNTSWFSAVGNVMTDIVAHARPFAVGLGLGLALALYLWIRGLVRGREKAKALQKLREHVQLKLELEAEDMERRKREAEALRQERDNLRNLVQTLNQKPGRPEMRRLQAYQRALDIMFTRSPGFAPVWQMTLREAEEELEKAEEGVIPFFKRLAGTGATGGDKAAPALEEDAGVRP